MQRFLLTDKEVAEIMAMHLSKLGKIKYPTKDGKATPGKKYTSVNVSFRYDPVGQYFEVILENVEETQ